MGPSSAASSVLAQLLPATASSPLPDPHQCTHTDTHLLAEGTGLALPGFTLLCLDKEAAASTHKNAATGSKLKYIPTDTATKEWNTLRILQGRPYPDKELTLEITPLEAGLWHTVDFAKGCYLGQETLAKVANNKGERQKLYGFQLDRKGGGGEREEGGKMEEGMRLVDAAGKRAGAVTSYLPERRVGLAYIRKSVGADPMAASLFLEEKDESKVQRQIRVVDIPYAVRSATSSSPTPGGVAAGGGKSEEDAAAAAAATAAAAAEKAAEAERKAQKLAEMQARLAAFQAKKGQ